MIEVSNLVKLYGSKYALDNVSFSVGDREVLGFLGPNGAGKSTAMNIMTGYLSANSGNVKIGGVDVAEKPDEAKKLIGYLPEQPPLYTEMKVCEYLDFVYELKGCKFNRRQHLDEILKVTRLSQVSGRLIKNLSKGYRQRVGIAQALVGDPKVLIFDEPTVGLDPKQIIEIRNLIRRLGRDHTVVLSTHILSEVQAVCDRIVIINEGRILADEKTEDINRTIDRNTRYRVKICGPQPQVMETLRSIEGAAHVEASGDRERDCYTYHIESSPGTDVRKPLFFAMAEKGWPIIGLEQEGLTLEEVFIRLTDGSGQAERGRRGRRESYGKGDNR